MPPKDNPKSYHQKYLNLKKKFKTLLYENESFQEDLRKSQKKLMRISRDKSFLLDRLLKYENVESSTTDSEATVSSDSEHELQIQLPAPKSRKRAQSNNDNQESSKKKLQNNLDNQESNKKRAQSMIDTQELRPTSSVFLNNTNEVKKKKPKRAPIPKPVSVVPRKDPVKDSKKELMKIGHGHMTLEELERHLESKVCVDLIPERFPTTCPNEIFSD